MSYLESIERLTIVATTTLRSVFFILSYLISQDGVLQAGGLHGPAPAPHAVTGEALGRHHPVHEVAVLFENI